MSDTTAASLRAESWKSLYGLQAKEPGGRDIVDENCLQLRSERGDGAATFALASVSMMAGDFDHAEKLYRKAQQQEWSLDEACEEKQREINTLRKELEERAEQAKRKAREECEAKARREAQEKADRKEQEASQVKSAQDQPVGKKKLPFFKRVVRFFSRLIKACIFLAILGGVLWATFPDKCHMVAQLIPNPQQVSSLLEDSNHVGAYFSRGGTYALLCKEDIKYFRDFKKWGKIPIMIWEKPITPRRLSLILCPRTGA